MSNAGSMFTTPIFFKFKMVIPSPMSINPPTEIISIRMAEERTALRLSAPRVILRSILNSWVKSHLTQNRRFKIDGEP